MSRLICQRTRGNELNIHLENVNLNSASGPNSFAGRLSLELMSRGHRIVDTYKQSDVTCVFIQSNSSIPEDHPKVHRLDGIWFKPEQFETHNTQIKSDYQNSHRVIWQSDFDKKMTEKYWGSRPGSVIGNGIRIKKATVTNTSILSLRKKYSHIFVCSANWHPQKRLSKNIDAFFRIRSNLKEKSCLVVMGNSPDFIAKDPDVFYTGSIPHAQCLEIFAAADWMLHLAWLDHCPNTVVEAISQGCPVICTDSGGTHEIVKNNGFVIPESNVYNFELTDYDKPYDIDLSCLDSFDAHNKPSIRCDYLDIKKVADKYLQEFNRAIEDTK